MANDTGSLVPEGPIHDFSGLGFAADEVLVVTGGGSGIGRAVARTAARAGLVVAVWDIDGDAAAAVAGEISASGGSAFPVTVDVGVGREITEAWAATLALGRCRYLVNNAGPPSTADLGFKEAIALAVGSMEEVTRTWTDHGVADASAVVNMASVAGNFESTPAVRSFYPSSKAAIAGLTRHHAVLYGAQPRVNAVAPGMTATPRMASYMDTPFFAELAERMPMKRAAHAEEIAAVVLFLLSPAASYVNGALVPVDGANGLQV